MAVGIEHLKGIVPQNDLDKFGQAFFFSVQTFTTVGYGHISPSGFLSSLVASIEALFGLLSFAIATGLFYGRFSRAKAHIAFSNHALIAPFQNQTALMFRIAPYKNTNLFDAEATIIMGIPVEENGIMVNKFYSLALEMDKISTLTLSWTLVHPITEDSPLYQMKEHDFQSIKGEIIVYIKAFDDMYSTTVVKRTSYTFGEVCYGARFIPMFSKNEENTQTILHLDKLHLYEKVSL
jgi:inward rectifier potassium channel